MGGWLPEKYCGKTEDQALYWAPRDAGSAMDQGSDSFCSGAGQVVRVGMSVQEALELGFQC
jgi:hypothetical protein